MKNHERLMTAAVLGAVTAYLIGLAVMRWEAWAGLTVAFVIEIVALYLGWTWARREAR